MIENVKVIKIKQGTSEYKQEPVIKEIPFIININEKDLVTLVSSPNDLEDLATGFLFTSGLITEETIINNLFIDYNQWKAFLLLKIDSSKNIIFNRLYNDNEKGILYYKLYYNKQKVISDFSIKSSFIMQIMSDFQQKKRIFSETGGAHSAAICDKEKGILFFREDISRHNAIDKVIGAAVAQKIPIKDKFIITSGRISSELVLKCRISNIPLVISKSAPTSEAVRVAKSSGVILAGFVRGSNMNIYSEYEKVDYY